MSNKVNITKTRLILEWVIVNFAAWICFNTVFLFIFPLLGSDTRTAFFSFGIGIVGCLLGSSIGTFQSLWLNSKEWHIHTLRWILVSSLSWGFSMFLFSIWSSIIHLPSHNLEVCSIYAGAVMGTLQILVWRKSILKSILWIIVNILAMLALTWSLYGVLLFPVTFKAPLLNILHSLDIWVTPKAFYVPFIFTMLPIVGTITTSIPTGFALSLEWKSKNLNLSNKIADQN